MKCLSPYCIPTCALLLLLASSLHLSTAAPSEVKPVASVSSSGLLESDVLDVKSANRDTRGTPKDDDDDDDDDEEEDDDDDDGVASELTPISEKRKTRGNGIDEDGNDITAVGDVFESFLTGMEREGRGELDGDIMTDTNLDERFHVCLKDGENCQENAGCCSGFCSWTRDFTCYTVAG